MNPWTEEQVREHMIAAVDNRSDAQAAFDVGMDILEQTIRTACMALCPWCRDGLSVSGNMHKIQLQGGQSHQVMCQAYVLRRRFSQIDWEPPYRKGTNGKE